MEAMIYNVWTAGSFDTVYLSQGSQCEQNDFVLKSQEHHWFLQTFQMKATVKSYKFMASKIRRAAQVGSIICTILSSV